MNLSRDDQSIHLSYRPKVISMTATTRCNLRCVMCDHGLREVEKQDFDAALIGNIGDFISSAELVDLTGIGEPLLSKFFWEVLESYPVSEETTEGDFILNFNTNGTLLTKENIQKILKARVRRIRISIDAADDELYYKIRGIKLSHVVAGVRNLILNRNSFPGPYPKIGLQMTLMKENLNSVKAMIDLCKDVGADFLEIWSLNNLPESIMKIWVVNKNGWVFNYKDQMLDGIPSAELNQVIAHFHEYARHKRIPVCAIILGNGTVSEDFPYEGYMEDPSVKWREESIRCMLPWKEQRITPEGNVYACCWGPKPIGNIRNATLESIWNGQAIQEMRSDLIDGKVPRLCAGAPCPYMIGRPDAQPDVTIGTVLRSAVCSLKRYGFSFLFLRSFFGILAQGTRKLVIPLFQHHEDN